MNGYLEILMRKKLKEIALTQYPYLEMEAYTIQKDFRNALDPIEPFIYEDLQSKVSIELALTN